MKERPILFSGPMVRAILEERKTQTRRTMKPQPPTGEWDVGALTAETIYPTKVDRHGEDQPGPECFGATCESGEWCLPCPYGAPGDLLWVRETWAALDRCIRQRDSAAVNYRASDTIGPHLKWRPSIFMPRWASRLTLRITDIRVERLQEITGDDAFAEGIQIPCSGPGMPLLRITGRVSPDRFSSEDPRIWKVKDWARFEYAELWEQINGKGSWDANPWVWVITFERFQQEVKAA